MEWMIIAVGWATLSGFVMQLQQKTGVVDALGVVRHLAVGDHGGTVSSELMLTYTVHSHEFGVNKRAAPESFGGGFAVFSRS